MGFSLVNCAMCLRAPIPDVVVLSHCEAIILRFCFAMLRIHFPTHLMRLSVDNVDKYWLIWNLACCIVCLVRFQFPTRTIDDTNYHCKYWTSGWNSKEIQNETDKDNFHFLFAWRIVLFRCERHFANNRCSSWREGKLCAIEKFQYEGHFEAHQSMYIHRIYVYRRSAFSDDDAEGYVSLAQLPLYNLRKYRKTQKYPFGQSIVCFCERTFITSTKSFVPATEYTCENDSSMLENVGKRRMNAVSFEYRYI